MATARLGSSQFQLLNDYLEQMHFFDLEPTYAPVPRGTDGTEETIVVNCSAGTKSVYTYNGGGPAMLWAPQQLLSNTVHDAPWKLAQ